MNRQQYSFADSICWILKGVALTAISLTVSAWGQNPAPQIVGPVKPQAVAPGGGAFTLTVYGANFVSGAVVSWNGQPRATKFVSRRELQARILAADIAQNTAATISVNNPPPRGGNSSTSFTQVEVHAPTATINPGLPLVLSSTHGIGYGPVPVADFNGDGKPDLFGDGITWLGRGDGTFQMGWSTQTYYDPFGVVYGDFNGDGKLDLAYVGFDYYNPYNPPRNLRVMLGDGTGKFHKGWSIWDQTGYGFQWLAVGDFNGDGKLDLAVIRTFKVDIFLGNGDGTFRNFKEFPVPGPPGAYGVNLVVGDFNGDGKLDLLTEDEFGDVYLLVGKGDGRFPYPAKAVTSGNCRLEAVSDFNADGKLDILMGCRTLSDSHLTVLLGNGDGTFQQPLEYPITPAEPYTLATGDFNSDGNTDVIVSNGGNAMQFLIFLGNGDGTFQAQQVVNLPEGWNGEGGITAGDFNSDGLLDFMAVDPSYEGFVYVQQ